MAALTATTVRPGVDLSVTYEFTTVNDGDTFNVGVGKTSVVYQMIGDPSTQTDAGASLAYNSSTGIVTIYPGVNGLGGLLRVFPK